MTSGPIPISQSTVFNALVTRVTAAEAGIAAGNTTANLYNPGSHTLTVPILALTDHIEVIDANFTLSIPSSNPRVTFDNNDYLRYDRSANNLSLMIGGFTAALFSSLGMWQGDAQFGLFYNGGTQPILNFDTGDSVSYDRTTNKLYVTIGGVNVMSIDASGNMRVKGTVTASVIP